MFFDLVVGPFVRRLGSTLIAARMNGGDERVERLAARYRRLLGSRVLFYVATYLATVMFCGLRGDVMSPTIYREDGYRLHADDVPVPLARFAAFTTAVLNRDEQVARAAWFSMDARTERSVLGLLVQQAHTHLRDAHGLR